MTAIRIRFCAVLAASAVTAAGALAACSRTTSGTPRPIAGNPGQPPANGAACAGGSDSPDGAYSGSGPHLQIHFTVAHGASVVCGLAGNVLVACADGSAAADSVLGYSDPDTIRVSGVSFSDRYRFGSGSVVLSGQLDGRGGASGTFLFSEPSCTSQTVPWQAALGGSTAAAAPTTEAAQPCSPQPCGTLGGLTATVSAVTPAVVAAGGTTGQAAFVISVTVSNGTSAPASLDVASFTLQPGTGASFVDTQVYSATDSSGGAITCSHGTGEIAAGQAVRLAACYAAVNPVPAGTPLTLDWTAGQPGAPPVAIDLGPAP